MLQIRLVAKITVQPRLSSTGGFLARTTMIDTLRSQATRHQSRRLSRQTRLPFNNGHTIPALGFGTFQDADAQEEAVEKALKAGYRHLDTARIYDTESQTGRGIKRSGVPREEIFIATKLWMNSHHPEDVEGCLDLSLDRLGTEYIDCLMMHYPVAFARGDEWFPVDKEGKIARGETSYIDTWKAMEKLLAKGKARAIGLSNFDQGQIQDIIDQCDVPPAVHQIELHPYLQQKSFVQWHREKGIHNTQFSPLGNSNTFYASQVWARPEAGSLPPPMDHPVLVSIAKKHSKTPAQICYAWGINNGRSVLAKSVIDWQIQENMDADFELDKEDMERIGGVDKGVRFNDPSGLYRMQFYQGLDGFKMVDKEFLAEDAVGKI